MVGDRLRRVKRQCGAMLSGGCGQRHKSVCSDQANRADLRDATAGERW
jgi:hypothetical protein